MRKVIFLFVGTATLFFTSCKPFQEEKYEEVKPNETAYVIPLENGSKTTQSKLKSVEYLEQNKVVAKRIYVPTQWHETGRMAGDGEWIPSVIVIKVDRTPVTREWNNAGGGSNTTKNDAILVESKESIGFSVCITATTSIPEEWATKFLYTYNGKSLSQVMDNDVRAYIQNILTTEFGKRTLSQCQNERTEVFNIMRKDVTEHFEQYGIKIMNIGSAGQFTYTNEKIQEAINEKYASEMKVTTAKNEVEAAQKFAQAKNAIVDQKMLDADIAIKTALATAIASGRLNVPTTVAGQGVSIMDLYGLNSITKKK